MRPLAIFLAGMAALAALQALAYFMVLWGWF
jgi:hypothetical protein